LAGDIASPLEHQESERTYKWKIYYILRPLMKRVGIEVLYREPDTSKKRRVMNLSLPGAQPRHQPGPTKSGIGHDLHSNDQRICLSYRCRGLGLAPSISRKGSDLEVCHAVDVLQETFHLHGKR
jgi:hypothetical protein